MYDGWETIDIQTQSSPPITIHGVQKPHPTGPPLLLLHGFPQTHHIWHLVAPHLTSHYTIIALDLRGYGASSKPASSPGLKNHYAKSLMAADIASAMTSLNYQTFFICAHDRGARVAHKLLVDHPSRVRAAIFLDICPTLAMYEQTSMVFAKAYWHWFFLIQPSPLPETLINGSAEQFVSLLMGGRPTADGQKGGVEKFDKGAFREYVRVMKMPEAVHAMCEDYRAAATVDLEEARADLEAGRLIRTPLRVLWGRHGVIEACFDAVKEWKAVAEPGVSVDGYAVDSGHYIPEEAPGVVVKAIREFFV